MTEDTAVELEVRTRRSVPIGRHAWLLRRVVFAVVSLFCISVIVFVATQALPSDPAKAILGQASTPERLAELRHELGLDRPLLDQYGSWLGGILTGDPGQSLAARIPVTTLLRDRIVNSLILVGLTAAIAIPPAIVLGSFAAFRRDRLFDRATFLVSLGITALPDFVIGILLVVLFGTTVLTVLPAVAIVPVGGSIIDRPLGLVLPVATLVLAIVPYLYRLVRASVIDVLESEYVEMARLKGMPDHVVLRRHALPNALVAMVQACALELTYLVGGIIVVEFLFRYPGLGSGLADAVANRDLPVIQAIVLIFATCVIAFNLVADVLTVVLTPRLRTGSA